MSENHLSSTHISINSAPLPVRACQGIWRLYCYAIPQSLGIVRRQGWRALLRQRGWKFFAAIVTYYLVRDILIYVVVPLCVARRLF